VPLSTTDTVGTQKPIATAIDGAPNGPRFLGPYADGDAGTELAHFHLPESERRQACIRSLLRSLPHAVLNLWQTDNAPFADIRPPSYNSFFKDQFVARPFAPVETINLSSSLITERHFDGFG